METRKRTSRVLTSVISRCAVMIYNLEKSFKHEKPRLEFIQREKPDRFSDSADASERDATSLESVMVKV